MSTLVDPVAVFFNTPEEDGLFYQALTKTIEEWSDIQAVSQRLHETIDLFECLDGMVTDMETNKRMKPHFNSLQKLRKVIGAYGCIQKLAPRVGSLLKCSIMFVINGLAAKSSPTIVLEEKDVKRLGTAYATVILNITANPKVWLDTNLQTPLVLIEWKKDMEKQKVDKETFTALRTYLARKIH
jgi:hypothetical protein